MRTITSLVFAVFFGAAAMCAQIPAPQIPLTGNIGCQGFPCLNNGTLIMSSDANYTMTARDTSAMYIKVTSSVPLTATRNIVMPAGNFPFTIENSTTGGQAIQIIGPSGTGITIQNGQAESVWYDGTNVVLSSNVPGVVCTGTGSSQVCTFPGTVTATGSVQGAGLNDTLRPWVDTFTLPTGYGGGTDECAKLYQLGLNTIGSANNNGSIFRSTGVSGQTISCTTPFFPASLTGSKPSTPTPITIKLNPGAIYKVPSEVGTGSFGDNIDGQSTYLGGAGTGTQILADSTKFAYPSPSATYKYPVVASLGPTSQTTGGNAFSLYSSLRNAIVGAPGIPNATCVLNGFSQEGSEINVGINSNCHIGVDMENLGGGGGDQNHGVVTARGAVANGSGDLEMTAARIQNSGSYSQAPAITVTGCTTPPTYTAVMSGTSISYLQVGAPNYFGSGCSPTGTTISIDSTYGSGGSAIAVVESTQPNIMVNDAGAGDGTFLYNSTGGGGSTGIQQPYGFSVNAEDEYWWDTHCESVTECMAVANTNITGLNIIDGLRLKAGNNNAWTTLHLYNTATNWGLFARAIQQPGIGGYSIIDDQPNGGKIPNNYYHQAGVTAYAREGNTVFSMSPYIATTDIRFADSYLNCGSGCTSTTQPRQFVPLKNVGGYIQAMSLSDTSEPVGIGSNGLFNTSTSSRSAVAYKGKTPCLFDPTVTVTPGDYVGISSNSVISGVNVAGCVDIGATAPTSGWYLGQTVVNNTTTGEYSIPSAPNVSSSTVSSSPSGSVTYSYVIADGFTDGSITQSPPSTTLTTSTGPAYLGHSSTVTLNNLPATTSQTVHRVWRTAMGSSAVPTITVNIEAATGTAVSLTISSTSGYTFPPTVSFSGGGCTTEPAATLQVLNGSVSSYYFTNYGAGCTSSPTATVTKSSKETGFIGEIQGTTFTDTGIPGDGTTAPSSGQLGPLIHVDIRKGTGGVLTNPFTSKGQLLVSADSSGTPGNLNPGVAGTVLTSQGTGNLPTYTNTLLRVARSYCYGTATSSTTIFPFGLGTMQSGAACTGTSGNTYLGMLMPTSGTLSNLSVRCQTHGSGTAGQDTFTLYDTPVSGLAASTGISIAYDSTVTNDTMVTDSTHTYNYAAGDIITLRIVTQGSETLGNCSISFNY